MKPSREVVSTEVSQEVIPTGAVLPASGPREKVLGLLAVGVTLGEALAGFAKSIGLAEAIRLSAELAPSGVARMQSLFEVQREFEDKRAFGQACLDAGFHPAGVALAAVNTSEGRDAATRSWIEAKGLLERFGVDPWLADRLNDQGLLMLSGSNLVQIGVPVMVVPCGLSLEALRDETLSWLTEVGGCLIVGRTTNLSLPNLKAVGGYLSDWGSHKLSMPSLEFVNGQPWKGLG